MQLPSYALASAFDPMGYIDILNSKNIRRDFNLTFMQQQNPTAAPAKSTKEKP